MSEENLIIKIGSDVGEALEGIHKIGDEAGELHERFSNLTKIAAVGFAAFSAEIAISVVKFGELDAVSRKLSQSLQDQGIFTQDLKEKYVEYAEAVSEATGIEGQELLAAQATIQKYLGEKEVTEELTQAIADYAVAKGTSLTDAAEKLGKALEGNAGRLAQEGLEINKTMTEAERYGKVLDFVTLKYGGQAEAANQGLGGLKGLHTAFNDLQEAIGEKFAPVISAVIEAFTHLFKTIKENPALTEFAAAFLAAGAAIAGTVAFIGVLLPAIAAVSSAVIALGISFNVAFVGIPLLIGAIVGGAIYLASNWETVSTRIITVIHALGEFIASTFGSIGKILGNPFDLTRIKEGISEIKEAFSKGYADATKEIPKADKAVHDEQDREQAAFAKKQQLQKKLENDQKLLQQKQFREDVAALELVYNSKDALERTTEENKKLEQLRNSIKTERDALIDEEDRKLKLKIDADNRQLAEAQRYGVLYAAINKAMHSSEVEGTKSATGELVALQGSKNETLKTIGKAAAVTQIVIKTAESAMNIYAGFSEIPIIGPILGIAGAAAAIAYGAEQIGNVTAANQGGLITGGVPGTDSVAALLTPGELVVPERNFNEVVGAVGTQRAGGGGGSAMTEKLLQQISDKLDAKAAPPIQINGDMIGDDVMVDRLIRKINDAVLYRNAQVLTRPGGVTGGA